MTEDLLRVILPSWLLDHFELIDLNEFENEIHIYLDEKEAIPTSIGYSQYTRSKGFTEESVIQDFPIRGKAVFLHIRRRRWVNLETNFTFTSKYEITQQGTKMTKELATFLKEAYRD